MLFLLVSFLSFFLLLTKSLPPLLPSWASEMRLLCLLLCQEFIFHSLHWLKTCRLVSSRILKIPLTITMLITNKKSTVVRRENVEVEESMMMLLDLPELALELILEKLSPAELLKMASVCFYMREKCRSDHLWERHFREKWGRVIGQAARREWESYSSSRSDDSGLIARSRISNWLLEAVYCFWPFSWLHCKEEGSSSIEIKRHLHLSDSMMALYLSLESGRFWFPAQVYNREQNGHVGFMLSCYDAELSYDSHTDTFHARYPPHGKRATNVEEGVQWDRLRVAPLDTAAHDLHISDCLNDLRPGDHVEIQWRRNKEFPYGWWYGVVGHLESCDGAEHHCRCYNSDTVLLEFNQYSSGSRWRRTALNRKDHREEGNELDGFYGGVRKLYKEHEISIWKQLWPTELLG